ncbi:hypothetical protein ACO22_07222 [Paracoccidioides brasiliensis]|uniref:Uncharacterized protein n=1 Tax=Paracoccidioides brasiliensis TaxID=121759 RepID=A0A1D2J5A6_PARBR|nr:hypothetical protein ACO22_07222 [Paracoccidioides brasiliensis]
MITFESVIVEDASESQDVEFIMPSESLFHPGTKVQNTGQSSFITLFGTLGSSVRLGLKTASMEISGTNKCQVSC